MRRDDPEAYAVETTPPLFAPAAAIVEALTPCVTPERLVRIEQVIAQRTKRVAVVLDGIIDPHNASAVLRSCDAFGVQTIHVVDGPRGFDAAHKVSKGTDRWLDVARYREPRACAAALKARGYSLYLATMQGEATPEMLRERAGGVAIVLGNEHRGASPEMTAACDGTFAIPMRGFAESLNVSVAAAITLYALTQGRAGDLDAGERETLTARFLLRTVRDAERVVREHLSRRSGA